MTSCEILVTNTNFLVALATRKVQFRTLRWQISQGKSINLVLHKKIFPMVAPDCILTRNHLSFIADSKNTWLEPKFTTECFFMAIQAHHLAILPACRRHSRRQKAHRELTRMIEHLESHESEWIETPMASRNKSLLKKWREQIKVTRNSQ